MRLAKLQSLVTGQDGDTARQIRFAIIELRIARPGSTITYPNGQTATNWAGQAGATWYDPQGQALFSNGPQLGEDELLDVPRVALQYLWVEEDEGN